MGDTGGDLPYSHISIGQLKVLLILILFLTCHSFLIAITGMVPLWLTIILGLQVEILPTALLLLTAIGRSTAIGRTTPDNKLANDTH